MYPLFFVIINFPPYVNELLTPIRFLYLLSYNNMYRTARFRNKKFQIVLLLLK